MIKLNKYNLTNKINILITPNKYNMENFEYIDKIKNNDPDMYKLSLMYNDAINYEQVKEMAEALKHNKSLDTLNISNNDDDIIHGVETMTSVSYYFKCDNSIHIIDNYFKEVFQAIKNNTTIKSLNIYYNNSSPVFVEELAEAIGHNSSLEKLGIHLNPLQHEQINKTLQISENLKMQHKQNIS